MEKQEKDESAKSKLFNFQIKSNKSLAASLMKNVFFLFFAVIFFGATLYADQMSYIRKTDLIKENTVLRPANESVSVTSNGQSRIISADYEINTGDVISSEERGNIEIALAGTGILRLDNNTEIEFSMLDNHSKAYVVKLLKGGVWVNASYDDYNLKIQTDYAYIKPENASFSVRYDGSNTKIYSSNHDVYVGVVYNNEEINSFWLPEGNSVNIQNAKISEKYDTIKKLLYSKLIKEFNYGRLSQDSIKNDPWLSTQIDKDDKYGSEIKNAYLSRIRSDGLNSISTDSIRYQFKSLVSDIENVLTLSEQKKITRLLEVLFENLHDSQYLFLQGNTIDAELRLSIFKQDITSADYLNNEIFNRDLYAKINYELAKGIFINPADNIYPAKRELINQLFSTSLMKYMDDAQKFKILAVKLNDVSDSAGINPEAAAQILIEYFDLYKKVITGYKDRYPRISGFLERHNILVDNVLSKYPKLYKIEIFENKRLMEENYLASIEGGNDKKEQRQTFISNKIDLLSRIKFFLFDDIINADDARQIVFLLIEDIENLKKDTLDLAAVNSLFEKRLSDFGVFWQYLNSPEYSTTPLHGRNHQERFEAFKNIQKQILSFQDVREEILGQEEVQQKPTVEGNIEKAKNDLNGAGIINVEFGYYNDISQTRIPILKASVSGITFRATYEFEKQLLSNIIVNDKLISSEGVKLVNAKTFITQTLSSVSTVIQPPITEEEPRTEDPQAALKNAARVFVAEKFSKTGMSITKDNVEVVNFDTGEYLINNVFYTENRQATFSFSYLTKEDKIFNLNINTAAGVKEVTDTFVSSFLKPVVLKIYDEARLI